MSEEHIQQGNIGTVFEIEVIRTDTGLAYDLTGNDTLTMIFEKEQDGSTIIRTATAPTPANGKIEYTTIADDLDTAGWWKVQARIQGPSTVDLKTEFYRFRVFENL